MKKIIFAIIACLTLSGCLETAVYTIQPSQVGGNTCSVTSGILITNHAVDSSNDTMHLVLSNQRGSALENVQIDVSGTAGGSSVISSLGNVSQTEIIQLSPGLSKSETYSLEVSFSYTDRDGLQRTATATCNGTAS